MTTRFKRVMVKVSGESLLGERTNGIDPAAAADVARRIKEVHDLGVEVVVVVGGGNIFRGASASQNGMDRATADYMGMLATVMNGMALLDAFRQANVPARLQSALKMDEVAEPFLRNKAIRHLEKGRVVILSGGTGKPFVTTDTGASLHALELHCDVFMKATKVDGVYDRDPMKYPDAKRYKTLPYKDAIIMEGVEVMDTGALAMCMENNLPIMVFELFEGDNLIKAVEGEAIGTYLSNDVKAEFA